MRVPDDLRFTSDHEWVRVTGDVARVGITEHAQDALGDVVFVDLPEPGTRVAARSLVCEVESTKSVSEVYAPISGTVSAVNESLRDSPALLNSDPYGEGWIMEITGFAPAELDALLNPSGYRSLLGG